MQCGGGVGWGAGGRAAAQFLKVCRHQCYNSAVWYGLILIGTPAALLLGIALDTLLGGARPGYKMLAQIAAQPSALLPALLIGLIGGPLSEELGWRGFALERMSRRWGLRLSSLLLGLI
jgi:membrane protease YdiL (CAAX protease family)